MRCSSSLTVEPGKSGLPVAISYWMQPTPLQGAMGRANISLGLLAPALLALLHRAPPPRRLECVTAQGWGAQGCRGS